MEKDIMQIFLHGKEAAKESIIKPVPAVFSGETSETHKKGVMNLLNSIVHGYVVDKLNKDTIATLFNYFTGNEEVCEKNGISLNKGIMLCGGVGTGKTVLMQAMKFYTGEVNKINSFQFYTASEIIDNVNVSGVSALERFNENINSSSKQAMPITCYIDDIGSKRETVKNFGTDISVMDQLVSIRYNIFSRYKKLTHFSTNLYPKDMDKVYDTRIIDRLVEMCNIIELPGKSRRK